MQTDRATVPSFIKLQIEPLMKLLREATHAVGI